MINLFQALRKLQEIEGRDGPSQFIDHIFGWTRVSEYYLDQEFGMQYGGSGDKNAHYPHPRTGQLYDLQYVQVAYAISKKVGLGPVGRVVAAGYLVGWIDFVMAAQAVEMVFAKSKPNWAGLAEFAVNNPNHNGWVLGMAASKFPTFSSFVESYLRG